MSSSSKEKSGKKKKDVWQEAGGEFYQEQYPCGSGQAASTDDINETTQRRVTRPHIPLPSMTARRNSFILTGGPGRKYSRKHSLTTATINATNCMTYTSTMGGVANGNDVHVALMPDLADETIPNEKVTHEAIQKIRVLTESMGLKRLRKAKISAIPKLRLHGWRNIKWESRKIIDALKYYWIHRVLSIALFQNSLRKIEVRGGTSIVNVFLFIKWIMFLNLAMSFAILIFILFPYLIGSGNILSTSVVPGSKCQVEITNISIFHNYSSLEERRECCTKEYLKEAKESTRGSLGLIVRLLFRHYSNESYSIENSPFFYGYYVYEDEHEINWFAISYASTFTGIMLFSLLLMVRSIGQGVQELIQAGEGEFYKYSNLIFAGWDCYTKDDTGASFKKKILHHEMKIALQAEKRNLESLIRNRKQRIKLSLTRVGVNIIVILLLGFAGTTIYIVSGKSLAQTVMNQNYERTRVSQHLENLVYSFAPSLLISFYNLIFPTILGKLGKFEKYSAEKETALILIRALFIRLMSIGFSVVRFYIQAYCELEHSSTSIDNQQTEQHFCLKCSNDSLFWEKNEPRRTACWESLFADQVYKLLAVDLLIKVVLTFFIDPLRIKLKKCFKNNRFFKKIGILKFNIVRHSLDMIYLQVLSWLGMYFGPLIPIVAVLYCYLAFYIKKFSVLHNCSAVPDTFKTIRTTTIYVAAKLLSFIAVALTNVIVIGYMVPSRGCGPFRDYNSPWESVLKAIHKREWLYQLYIKIASPGITTPITIILILLSYYYYSVAQANRGMVDTLRHLLILEGHDKQYLFARLNSLRRNSVSARSDSTIMRRDQ